MIEQIIGVCNVEEIRGNLIKFFLKELKSDVNTQTKARLYKWATKTASSVKNTPKKNIQALLEELLTQSLFVENKEQIEDLNEEEEEEDKKETDPKGVPMFSILLNKAFKLLDTLVSGNGRIFILILMFLNYFFYF